MNWITDVFDNSFIINSKISLARNIKKIPFNNKLKDDIGRKTVSDIQNIFYKNNKFFEGFKFITLWEDEELSNLIYEKLLIDYDLIKNSTKSAFIMNEDENIVIMINGNSHLKFEYTSIDLNFEKYLDELNKIDDLFEEDLRYAFDEKLGYLASGIMNLGLGLEVSAMLHLPALTVNKKIKNLSNKISKLGISLESQFSENLEDEINIYKIYNATSIGVGEKNIISKLNSVIEQIIFKEQLEREYLLNNSKFELFDKIFKSLGILKNSYIISQKEAFKLLSSVRMGVEMSIINNIDKKLLNKLLVNIQTKSLKNTFKLNDISKNGDIERAQYIREVLTNSL